MDMHSLLPVAVDLSSTWDQVNDWLNTATGSIVLRIAGAISMLILGWILAKFIAWITYKALCRTTWDDKLAEQLGLNMLLDKEKEGDENAIERAVAKVVYWILLALVVVAALQYSGLTQVAEPIQKLVSVVFEAIPRIGFAVAILVAAYFGGRILKLLVLKVSDAAELDKRFAELAEEEEGEPERSFGMMLGTVVFWLVMFFGIAGALDALEIEALARPVSNAVDELILVLPALAKAAVIIAAGYFLGKIARTVVTNLLDSVGLDKAVEKIGIARLFEKTSAPRVAGQIVFWFIMIQVLIAGLNELGLETFSDPLTSMMAQFWNLLPSLAVAALIVAVGVVLGRVVRDIVERVLKNAGFDDLLDKVGLGELASRNEQLDEPSELVAFLVMVAIILVAVAQALQTIGLTTWADYLDIFLGYSIQHVTVAIAIVLVGYGIANYVHDIIAGESEDDNRRWMGLVARYAVLAIAFTMAVRQLDIAPDFVNIAFALAFGALCLGLALAFGLGSRDVAEEIVKAQYAKAKKTARAGGKGGGLGSLTAKKPASTTASKTSSASDSTKSKDKASKKKDDTGKDDEDK